MAAQVLRRWLPFLVAALVLGGAGCGGGDGGGALGPGGAGGPDAGDAVDAGDDQGDDDDATPAGAGDSRDGCQMVTRGDAEAILGEPVSEAAASASSGRESASCHWEVQDETSFKLLQFNLFEGRQFYGGELFKDDPNYEKVEGLGDDAFFTEPLGVQLQVLDGDTVLLIDVTGFNTDPPLDKEKVKEQLVDLARRVLAQV